VPNAEDIFARLAAARRVSKLAFARVLADTHNRSGPRVDSILNTVRAVSISTHADRASERRSNLRENDAHDSRWFGVY